MLSHHTAAVDVFTRFLSTMSLTPADIANRYCAALTSPGADATQLAPIFAAQVTVYHCWDEKPIRLPGPAIAAAMARKLALCFDRVRDYSNVVQPLHIAPTGISIGITARGFYPDGSALFICRCVLLTLGGTGSVERVDNYGDHALNLLLDQLIPHKDILKQVGH